MSGQMRLGIVGAGAIARAYAAAIATGSTASLVAVADVDGGAAEAMAEAADAKAFRSHSELADVGPVRSRHRCDAAGHARADRDRSRFAGAAGPLRKAAQRRSRERHHG